jgi:hypothetical protein
MLSAAATAPSIAVEVSGNVALTSELYLERPILGVGLNVFPALYAARRPLWDQESAGRFVHNDYAQFLLEGGPLLALALLLLGFFCARMLWRAMRAPLADRSFSGLGFALACGAVLGHAAVNFVFYCMSLPLVFALVFALAHARISEPSSAGALSKHWLWAPLLLGWVAWGYLLLDLAIAGVIEGQQTVPFAAQVRQDPQRMHRFALLAHKLNDDRGLPVLVDAAMSAQNPSQESSLRALAAFRKALVVDPWNTQVYVEFYRFLQKHPQMAAQVPDDEQPVALLLRAVALDRQFLPALNLLLSHFEAAPARRNDLLLRLIAPWLELIARKDLDQAWRYYAELESLLDSVERARLQALLQRLDGYRQQERLKRQERAS